MGAQYGTKIHFGVKQNPDYKGMQAMRANQQIFTFLNAVWSGIYATKVWSHSLSPRILHSLFAAQSGVRCVAR